jgi:hypothetical protein
VISDSRCLLAAAMPVVLGNEAAQNCSGLVIELLARTLMRLPLIIPIEAHSLCLIIQLENIHVC